MQKPFTELQNLKDANGRHAKVTILEGMGTMAKRLVWEGLNESRLYNCKQLPVVPEGKAKLSESTLAERFLQVISQSAEDKLNRNGLKDKLEAIVEYSEPRICAWMHAILNHDLKVGVSAETYEHVFPGSFTKFKSKSCRSYNPSTALFGDYQIEPKYDVTRCYIHLRHNGTYTTYLESGKPCPEADWVAERLVLYCLETGIWDKVSDGAKYFGIVLDGGIRRTDDSRTYVTWDLLSAEDWQEDYSRSALSGRTAPLSIRRTDLEKVFLPSSDYPFVLSDILRWKESPSDEYLHGVLDVAELNGYDQIVIKRSDGLHEMIKDSDWRVTG